jgi:hypothetical protein
MTPSSRGSGVNGHNTASVFLVNSPQKRQRVVASGKRDSGTANTIRGRTA